MRKQTRIDNREFVVTWCNSHTAEDVAKAFDTTKNVVQSKATYLRKIGVRLPKFNRGSVDRQLEVAQLNSLIKQHTKQSSR